MSINAYILIGASIVVALIAMALIRKSRAKKAKPPSEQVVAPPAEVPQTPPDSAASPFVLEPSTTPPEPADSNSVEVWNQTNWRVVITQQDLRVTLPAQGRMQMDSRFPMSVAPETSGDAAQGVSLQSGETPGSMIIRAIAKQ